jgi:YVTN family beta-propeller protein
MKKLTIFVSLILSVILVSCTKDEQVINNYKDTWRFVATTDSDTPALMLVQMPNDSIINNDVFLTANGVTLSGKVQRIVEFQNMLYLFIPSKFKIEVLSKNDYKRVATIDFSASGMEPSDICFPNATTGYVAHGKDTSVSVVDITVFKVARTIKVGVNPVSITCSGNQIYVANRGDNTISVLDSRDNTQKTTITVPTAPSYIDMTSDGTKIVVISLGAGKLGGPEAKTAALASVIDTASKTIERTIDMGYNTTTSIDQLPHGLTITNSDWAYVPCQDNVLDFDARFGTQMFLAMPGNYFNVLYNPRRNELLMVQDNGSGDVLQVIDPDKGSILSSYTFLNKVNLVLPQ